MNTAARVVSRSADQWRFTRWRPGLARLAIVALILALTAAALVPVHGARRIHTLTFVEQVSRAAHPAPGRKRDADLALYDRVIARIGHGEHYYDFIVAEQRRSHYPVRPGLAVRLPTLAWIDTALGGGGQVAAAVVLALGVILAWWRRLGDELGGGPDDTPQAQRLRWLAIALIAFGASLGVNRYYFVLHELWSGMLLALAFGLHRAPRGDRPGRWVGAWCAAALALAIREHALPFVALMAAVAAGRRQWREAAAWGVLIAVFLLALAWHLHLIAAQVLPTDRVSAPWLVARGLSGWLSNVVLASNLRYIDRNLGGVIVLLAMFGWAAWRSPAGLFGFWLFAGYGVLFMLAGRWDNFYWGAEIAPAMFAGLAFVPSGLLALARAAAPRLLARRQPVLQTGA